VIFLFLINLEGHVNITNVVVKEKRGMNLYYSRKKPLEDVPEEITAVWSCPDDNCKGWMRDNFTFSIVPICPQCQSEMVKSERMLAAVVNTSPNQLKQ
jgi:hypothetical protein